MAAEISQAQCSLHHSVFSSSSGSTPPAGSFYFDIFLSFRGQDNRKNFIDHLYTALVQAGIHTFRDDDELPRGNDISSELPRAIRESRISMVFFSENYASSRWCLDELVEILEYKETLGQLVLPVFYNVNPNIVRNQGGSFADAFACHEREIMEKVEIWRAALTQASNLSGWDLHSVANGYESKFIRKLVDEVSNIVNKTNLPIAKHPIGMKPRLEELNSLVSIGSQDVHFVGIYGMGGIGKTTIAIALYNSIIHLFEGSCFLANIREESERHGLVHLQEQLLSELLRMKNKVAVANKHTGISLLRKRLCRKKVLIVLDDLDQLSQLDSLSGQANWFGSGSRIIITTRDEHLLMQARVQKRFEAKELNGDESLSLFSLHAFGKCRPLKDYAELSYEVVRYAGGLPLALEILGSYLVGRDTQVWRSALKKLQEVPHDQVLKILRISFDALPDDKVKATFLDIAFCFTGMDRDDVFKILKACGHFPEIEISILNNKCLLKICGRKKLRMHDLVRDMGKEIVREESPNNPEKRSRLASYEDICDVLEKDKGSETIEVLNLDRPMQMRFSTKAFIRMRNLRLVRINNVHLHRSYKGLFTDVKWFCWHHCPLTSWPPEFHPEKVVVLDLQYNKIKGLWRPSKVWFLESEDDLCKVTYSNRPQPAIVTMMPENLLRLVLQGLN